MKFFYFSVLSVLLLPMSGCSEKSSGANRQASTTSAQSKELTPVEYFAYTMKQAEAGVVDSQYNLGVMYSTGKGVPKDATKAVEWYQKAAEQGYAGAQYYLGVMYSAGEGVSKNDAKAVEWYQKAAAQGLAESQYSLGRLLCLVSKDMVRGYAWLNLAASQGNELAKLLRDEIEEKLLTPVQRAEGQRLSSNWKKGDVL